MSKKKHIEFRQTEDMENIDNELDQAMDQLDGVNTRIEDLLQKFDSGEDLPENADATSAETSSDAENDTADDARVETEGEEMADDEFDDEEDEFDEDDDDE